LYYHSPWNSTSDIKKEEGGNYSNRMILEIGHGSMKGYDYQFHMNYSESKIIVVLQNVVWGTKYEVLNSTTEEVIAFRGNIYFSTPFYQNTFVRVVVKPNFRYYNFYMKYWRKPFPFMIFHIQLIYDQKLQFYVDRMKWFFFETPSQLNDALAPQFWAVPHLLNPANLCIIMKS